MADELHIASLLVYLHPDHAAGAITEIEQLSGTELHGTSPEGKTIVVIESSDEHTITGHLNAITVIPGVLSANLIYHEVDDDAAEEVPPKTSPSSRNGHDPAEEAAR